MKKSIAVLCGISMLICNAGLPTYGVSKNETKSSVNNVKSKITKHKKDILKIGIPVATAGAIAVPTVILGSILLGRVSVNSQLFPGTHQQHAYNVKYLKPSTTIVLGENDHLVKVKREYLEIGDLKGAIYKATEPKSDVLKNKCVMFCGPNSRSVQEWMGNSGICKLLDAGASVVAVDYRGYGYSKLRMAHIRISQNTIYSDGETVYNYIKNTLHFKPENIISFGFSLGGSVASHIANYAEKQNEKLSGLILATPINNLKYAAKAESNAAGSLVARALTLSPLDTEKNLSSIKNKNLPIYLCSGNKDNDFLSLENTNLLETTKNASLTNVTSYITTCHHCEISKMFRSQNYDEYLNKIQ